MTSPSVAGDAGWYDAASKVAVSYNYVWNETQGSRMNAVGIKVDGGGDPTSQGWQRGDIQRIGIV